MSTLFPLITGAHFREAIARSRTERNDVSDQIKARLYTFERNGALCQKQRQVRGSFITREHPGPHCARKPFR